VTISTQLEVRVLGPLRVRRADGSRVDVQELRTGKTADLLRMLAVRSPHGLAVDTVLDDLWPAAERTRGLASLRTAVSQIRTVLGENCVSRQRDGLRLERTWIDATALRDLASVQRHHAVAHSWGDVIAVGHRAADLYVDGLSAYDPNGMMLNAAREALQSVQLDIMVTAAQAAVRLGRFADGVDFATRSLAMNPFCERAYRSLMEAHGGAGETRAALHAYERCRRVLAEELGADPSPQTHAVYLGLLAAPSIASGPRRRYERSPQLRTVDGPGELRQRTALSEVVGGSAVASG
jgi:DNA-binding SARP family transcriptional activator